MPDEDRDNNNVCNIDDCSGFTGMYMLTNSVTIGIAADVPFDQTLQQLCNVGDVATGGGAAIEMDTNLGDVSVIVDAPIPASGMANDPPIGWTSRIVGVGPANFDLNVFAICISDPNN